MILFFRFFLVTGLNLWLQQKSQGLLRMEQAVILWQHLYSTADSEGKTLEGLSNF